MFDAIASRPIGAVPETGAITGAASATVVITASATAASGKLEAGSLLGFGPIAAGAIGEQASVLSLGATASAVASATVLVTGAATGVVGNIRTLVAASAVDVAGASTGKVLVRGYAPDIISAPWRLEPADGAVFISSFPAAPEDPEWTVSVVGGTVTVEEYPANLALSVPFINVTGSATGGAVSRASAATIIEVDGEATGAVPGILTGGSVVDVTGEAEGILTAGIAAAGTVDVTGAAKVQIGNVIAFVQAAGSIDVTGSVTVATSVTATASGEVGIFAVSAGNVIIGGAAEFVIPITGTATGRTIFSMRRFAYARDSANTGILDPSIRSAVRS
jgi:hypothetical protein